MWGLKTNLAAMFNVKQQAGLFAPWVPGGVMKSPIVILLGKVNRGTSGRLRNSGSDDNLAPLSGLSQSCY